MAEPAVVFFDIGGVLLTNGWDRGSRLRAIETFGLDEDFEVRHKHFAKDLDCARITLDGYLDRVVFDRPRAFTRADFIAFMKSESKPYADTIAVLAEVAATGRYLVATLNNESRELNAYRIQTFELGKHVDVFLSSCNLGLAKPEPAIYERAIDIVAQPASACVFVDDRAENITPATMLGMRTIHHQTAAATREALRAAGVALTSS